MQHYDVMVLPLPGEHRVSSHCPPSLTSGSRDEFLGTFPVAMVRVRPDGGANELVAPEE